MNFRDCLNRLADLKNSTSSQTAGVYASKSSLSRHLPYIVEQRDDEHIILFTYHFLKGLRRILSGEVPEGAEQFSITENEMYDDYVLYVDGTNFTGERLNVLETLDTWLTDEVMNTQHTPMTREYTEDHPWRYTEERGARLWQQIF